MLQTRERERERRRERQREREREREKKKREEKKQKQVRIRSHQHLCSSFIALTLKSHNPVLPKSAHQSGVIITLSAQTMHSIVLFSLPKACMDFFLGSLVFQKFQISQKHLTLDQKNVAANMYTVQTVISRCLRADWAKFGQQYYHNNTWQTRGRKAWCFPLLHAEHQKKQQKFGEDWHFGSKDIAELHPLEFNNIWPPNRTKIRITLSRKIRAQPPPS